MGKETKDRILDKALICFAENGYKGTNLRDFAAGMGLSKSALYSHYESKEAIWNAMIDRMETYYGEHFGTAEHLPGLPKSCDELVRLVMKLLDFTIHDERIVLTRKLLLTEQFRDGRVKELATAHFLENTKALFQTIFESMIQDGLLIPEDPAMLAFAFTAPITALIHYCDREPEKEAEILSRVEAFVRHFIKIYGNPGSRRRGDRRNITIETHRLTVYTASEEQMKAFIAAQSVDVLKAAYTEMLNGSLAHPDQWEWYALWMIELPDGTPVGELCFKGLSEEGETEIGYGIAEAYRGRGYGTEAVSALVKWALRQPGVRCITAETEESNTASQKLLRKAGFIPTGEVGEEGPRYVRPPK